MIRKHVKGFFDREEHVRANISVSVYKDTEAYQSHVSPLKANCNTTFIVENYALVRVEMPEILRSLSYHYF